MLVPLCRKFLQLDSDAFFERIVERILFLNSFFLSFFELVNGAD